MLPTAVIKRRYINIIILISFEIFCIVVGGKIIYLEIAFFFLITISLRIHVMETVTNVNCMWEGCWQHQFHRSRNIFSSIFLYWWLYRVRYSFFWASISSRFLVYFGLYSMSHLNSKGGHLKKIIWYSKVVSYSEGVSTDPRSVVFCFSKRPGIPKKLTL